MLSTEEQLRYARHIVLSEVDIEGQLRLKHTKVLVIGAGGLGCPVLSYLAAAGIGTIGIVDHDVVSLSNLQRQVLYSEADIGKPKAETAKHKLQALNSRINIEKYDQELTKDNALGLLSKYDIIVDCSDNFLTRYLVNDASVISGKPLVYGAIHKFDGQVAVFNWKESGNYRDIYPIAPNSKISPDCNEAGVIGVLPGIIGTLQANEVIKLVCGIGEPLANKLFHFDALTLTSSTIGYTPSNKPITELINYEKFCNIDEPKINSNMKEITVQELKQLRDSGQDHQLIDVREQHEYDTVQMGGELIPMGEVLANLDKIDKNKQVVIHCRSGARSANVINALEQQHGYDNLYNLKGGIMAWANEIDTSLTVL